MNEPVLIGQPVNLRYRVAFMSDESQQHERVRAVAPAGRDPFRKKLRLWEWASVTPFRTFRPTRDLRAPWSVRTLGLLRHLRFTGCFRTLGAPRCIGKIR
jgi:hypothetical protein